VRLFTRLVTGVTGAGPVRRMITGTMAGRNLAERFVAGETLESASSVAVRLNQEGALVSLDYLGEEVSDPESAEAAAAMYRQCIERIVNQSINGNISVKLTQLGLLIDAESAGDSLHRLAANAAALGTTVTVDMEDSRHTDATLDLYQIVQSESGSLGICLQAALRRTPADLERLIPLGGHIRLCKGAYREPPEVAFQDKAEVDAAFATLLNRLMSAEDIRPAVATHDEQLID
jgi:proline dehydrogenase